MQPTPAPTSPPGSPSLEDSKIPGVNYTAAPQNSKGPSPPFGALVGLFERLQSERRQDKRKKLISSWFNASLYPLDRRIHWTDLNSIGDRKSATTSILFSG